MSPYATAQLFPITLGLSYELEKNLRAIRQAGVAFAVVGVPWAMLEPHENQAQNNHGQSLQRLAERGGLSACEAVAVLLDRRHQRMDLAESHRALGGLLHVWQVRQAIDATGVADVQT